ncbi:MAG: hypothetical protein Q9227_007965 [Pyrenula ochraceoflavens]
MPSNEAAYLETSKATALTVKSAPYTSPRSNEIVVENGAIAINPADHIKQSLGSLMYPWAKYPFIEGTDIAGKVVEVGSDVTRFKPGDRVLALALAVDKERNNSAEGAFQKYTVILAHMATPLPQSLSYERASVIPLGLATAASGLYQQKHLSLARPSPHPESSGKTLLIWGGSTSVGSNAIQLAVASGYEVITTSSPKNFTYVKSLGASHAVDYNSPTAVSELIQAFQGKTLGGAIAISPGSAISCIDVMAGCKGDKALIMASFPGPDPFGKQINLFKLAARLVLGLLHVWFKARIGGVKISSIFASEIHADGVGKAVFEDFLPEALAERRFVAAPEPRVVGEGLQCIQEAMEIQKKGVSASKIVVTL